MKILDFNSIKNLNINPLQCYDWIDEVLRNRDKYIMPTKTRIPLRESDYFNVMPCILPDENCMGLKVITRNENRRNNGSLNLDAQIYLYSYDNCELLAVMDGNYITTLRTAAVAVHTFINIVDEYESVAMVGLGNIGTSIGDILFEKTKDKKYIVKLYKYHGQEEAFIERFKDKYKNIRFEVYDNYKQLMENSDVIISSVTYIENDFCDTNIYKPGCTIIPVHMRGFMECDKEFEHVIVSDMERIEHFKYYGQFKKISLTDDVLFKGKNVRENRDDRVIVYNLGLAITDLYFGKKIYEQISNTGEEYNLMPTQKLYI